MQKLPLRNFYRNMKISLKNFTEIQRFTLRKFYRNTKISLKDFTAVPSANRELGEW